VLYIFDNTSLKMICEVGEKLINPILKIKKKTMIDLNANQKTIPPEAHDDLIQVLQNRFEKNMQRHPDMKWVDIHSRLEKSAEKMRSLYEMEQTGGEPDVVGYNLQTGEYSF